MRVRMSVTLVGISYRIQNMERNFVRCDYTLGKSPDYDKTVKFTFLLLCPDLRFAF